jgi:quinol-cytochrome oxidoreductase complex cytochrome b subunit
MIGFILIGIFILYVISLYKTIITIIDWETTPEPERTKVILIFFIISVIAFIVFNVFV